PDTDLPVVDEIGAIVRRHRLDSAESATRRASPAPPGKEPYDTGRRAARGSRVGLVRYFNDPIAAADRDPGDADDVFGLQPGLVPALTAAVAGYRALRQGQNKHEKRRGECGAANRADVQLRRRNRVQRVVNPGPGN